MKKSSIVLAFVFVASLYPADGELALTPPSSPNPTIVVKNINPAQIKIPDGAIPFEEIKTIDQDGQKIIYKKTGFKLEIDGKVSLVGPWKSEINDVVFETGFYDTKGGRASIWTKFFDGTNILSITTYKDGTLDGPCYYFGKTGSLIGLMWFSKGKREGIHVVLSEEGKIIQSERFHDDKALELLKVVE